MTEDVAGSWMSKRRIVCGFLLGMVFWGTALGQEDFSRKLNQARLLERQGRAEEAIDIYEELYRNYPQDLRVLHRLANAYSATERYDELIRIAQEALRFNPGNALMFRYLGQAYLKKGDKRRGVEVAERIIELDPKKKSNYHIAAFLLSSANLLDEAATVYLRGRKVLGDEGLFVRELAAIYQRNGNYQKATSELLSLLEANPRQALWVEREMKSMLRKGGSQDVVGVLERETEKEAPPQVHRILGDIYLSQGRYEDASREYERSGGTDALLQLGRMAEEEGLFDTALTTYRRVLDNSRDQRVKAEASLRIGASLRRLGRFEEALKALESAASTYPPIWGEAVYGMGHIYLEDLKEPRKAAAKFEEVLEKQVEKKSVDAGLSLVDCYLSMGDLRSAEETCQRLSSLSPHSATFLLAEVNYYEGDFDAALKLYGEVVEKYKEREVVNDALERILLIGESEREGLEDFAKAELSGIERRYDEGIDLLRKLIGKNAYPSLAPRATFLMGDLFKEKEEAHQAIGAYQDVIDNFPESSLCPYARLEIGEIYATELGDREKGIEQLEALLMEYPSSILCELVRERIEELRGL